MPPNIPSPTRTWHKDTYRAINCLQRPELRLTNKTVIVTGGGTGIGKGLAQAFADAGASKIAVIGRRDELLQKTKQAVEADVPSAAITTHSCDIVDLAALRRVANEVGKWDVLVSNAGYLPDVQHLVDTDPADWWRAK